MESPQEEVQAEEVQAMECFWCNRYSECVASGIFSCPNIDTDWFGEKK